MALPTVNLDTRRFADLVDEGRSLVPRYAPEWTDHNASDPGITILELLAWAVEQDLYRANRIPERNRRKFLRLVGFPPAPPRPARAPLAFSLAAGAAEFTLPAGIALAPEDGARYRTLAPVAVTATAIAAVQSFDGREFVDATATWRAGLPFAALGDDPPDPGDDPDAQPAVLVGLAPAPAAGGALTLWLDVAGGRDDERERLGDEEPGAACGVETLWECWTASGWRACAAEDRTAGLLLPGLVRLTLPPAPDAPATRPLGEVDAPLAWLRCRLVVERPDAAPVLGGIGVNVVEARQESPARAAFAVAPGVSPPASREPVPGQSGALDLDFEDGRIAAVAFDPGGDEGATTVLAFDPATASVEGRLVATLVRVGTGTGLPGQRVALPGAPLAGDEATIWTVETAGQARWESRPDLDASAPSDRHVVLDAAAGEVSFGDGRHGRVVEEGAPIVAAYATTEGGRGRLAERRRWRLAAVDDDLNAALLGQDPHAVEARLGAVTNPGPARGGADGEELADAFERAVDRVWAHERLVELLELGDCESLDEVGRHTALARPAPDRAATLVDYERLALDVPGTRVARARAWSGFDARRPCLAAPGVVSVVVVPELPRARPEPTRSLLARVTRFLARRRVLGTALVVLGPQYVDVSVTARLRARAGADPDRVREAAREACDRFLHPLRGGPTGTGWPFGRDVYRSEILQLLDGVDGVDHVTELALAGRDGERCDNVCVPPTGLVAASEHEIEVDA